MCDYSGTNMLCFIESHCFNVRHTEYIVLTLACVVFKMPEEEAFAVLVKLMQDYRMRDMFKPTMAELGLCMYQLENLVQVQLAIYTGMLLP